MRHDIKTVAAAAASRGAELLSQWLPGGRVVAGEYHCGGWDGGPGKSLKIEIATGKGKDFADDEKGVGDYVAIYARVHRSRNMGEAANELGNMLGVAGDAPTPARPRKPPEPPPPRGGPSPAPACSRRRFRRAARLHGCG